jgi:hypothetical protein
MRRILAILGDFYHPEVYLKEALEKTKNKDDYIDYIIPEDFHINLKNYHLIILGRENRIEPDKDKDKVWMRKDIESNIQNYILEGGKLLVWHSGLASYDPESLFVKDILRGYFKYHPEKEKVEYYGKSPKYGKDINFELFDEHYFVYCDKERTNVFLYSKSLNGESIAGWYHYYGNGRVVCITPAHNEALLDKHFLEFFKELIEWI